MLHGSITQSQDTKNPVCEQVWLQLKLYSQQVREFNKRKKS